MKSPSPAVPFSSWLTAPLLPYSHFLQHLTCSAENTLQQTQIGFQVPYLVQHAATLYVFYRQSVTWPGRVPPHVNSIFNLNTQTTASGSAAQRDGSDMTEK